jgi:very-short-patch-repair endonuclease
MKQPAAYAIKLMDALKKLGVHFIPEANDGHKHIDIRIPNAKLDVEVDGIQHLINPDQIITDIKRTDYSRVDGYETMRVHNTDLKEETGAIASAIAEVAAMREEELNNSKH